jgi:hypothetical protein
VTACRPSSRPRDSLLTAHTLARRVTLTSRNLAPQSRKLLEFLGGGFPGRIVSIVNQTNAKDDMLAIAKRSDEEHVRAVEQSLGLGRLRVPVRARRCGGRAASRCVCRLLRSPPDDHPRSSSPRQSLCRSTWTRGATATVTLTTTSRIRAHFR